MNARFHTPAGQGKSAQYSSKPRRHLRSIWLPQNLKSIVIIFNTEFDVITEYPMIISDTHFTAGLPVTAVILLCIFTQQFCFRYRFVLFSIFGQSLNVMTPQLITFILLLRLVYQSINSYPTILKLSTSPNR